MKLWEEWKEKAEKAEAKLMMCSEECLENENKITELDDQCDKLFSELDK